MEFTTEILEVIEKAANVGFDVDAVAHLIEMNPEDFEVLFINPSHPAVIAYNKGFYQAEFDLRTAEMASALSGSQPAQEGMKKHLLKAAAKLKEVKGNG
jgi:hypothetical protein